MTTVSTSAVGRELFDHHALRDPARERSGSWIVCQIGAREHYAVARALHARGELAEMVTDFWIAPGHAFGTLPGARRLQDRFHPDLFQAHCWAPNLRMLAFESWQRACKNTVWQTIVARNDWFQKLAVARLRRDFADVPDGPEMTLFSYSYAARELFRYAKSRGWTTVLGQIDPGPEEERIVREEHRRYSALKSGWVPTPSGYWDDWKDEVALADRIVVNSEWSLECLAKEQVPVEKMQVIPLVYDEKPKAGIEPTARRRGDAATLQVLFLGQINLRKGIGRLLDAMRLLTNHAIELTLAGPTEISPEAWAGLPNVRWVGPIPRSEVSQVYRESDIFILPTLSDGYALTQLESLANGLPVIASRHCGQAVVPGVNGWILEDLEPATIAARLAECARLRLESPEPARIERKGASDFTLEFLAQKLLDEGGARRQDAS